jgi:hypothetical protein
MKLKPWLAGILFLQVSFLPVSSYADERENGLKAGFLYNFARYSEGNWFDSTTSTQYNICTTSHLFARTANQVLKDQKIKGVSVATRFITSPQYDCHSLFISADTANAQEFLLSQEFDRTMIVGESKGFIQAGGQINFFIAGGRIRFEVDPIHLEQHQIKLSSKVLRMGRILRATNDD